MKIKWRDVYVDIMKIKTGLEKWHNFELFSCPGIDDDVSAISAAKSCVLM